MSIDNLEKIRKIHVIPYSHHDHAWCNTREWHIWRYIGFLAEALEEMRNNVEYTFAVDNAVHTMVPFERYCCDLLDEFKQRVEEGRIELVNGGYSLARPNYVGDETFVRNLVACVTYFKEHAGAGKVDVFLNCDTAVGHSQMPQILKLSGHDYYYFFRPEHYFEKMKLPREFVWQGIDGSRTVACRAIPCGFFVNGDYMFMDYDADWEEIRKRFFEEELSGRLTDLHITDEVVISCGVDDSLVFTNFFDRRLPVPEFIRQWNKREDAKMKFSTFGEYFRNIAVKDLPVVEGVIDPADVSFNPPVRSDGSLWRKRLMLDRLLLRSERLGAMLSLTGGEYPAQEIDRLWMRLFEVTGHAMEWLLSKDFEDAFKWVEAAETDAHRLIADLSGRLAGKAGRLGPIQSVVINPAAFERREIVEIHLASAGGINGFKLYDGAGTEIPYQIVDRYICSRPEACEFNELDAVAEVQVPSMGFVSVEYRTDGTKAADRAGSDIPAAGKPGFFEEMLVDNGIFQIKFRDGIIESLRMDDDEFYSRDGAGRIGVPYFRHNPPQNSWMASWDSTGLDTFKADESASIEAGPLRWKHRAKGFIGRSRAQVDTVICKDDPLIRFEAVIDNENGEGVYSAVFPAKGAEKVSAGIPFGAEDRDVTAIYGPNAGYEPGANKLDNCPGGFFARNFVSYDINNRRAAIIPEDCSIYYRHNPAEEHIELVLMKSLDWEKRTDAWVRKMHRSFSGEGRQTFKYAFHIGKADESLDETMRQAQRIQQPLKAVTRFHYGAGAMPSDCSFLRIDGGSMVLSSFHKEGRYILARLYEGAGRESESTVTLMCGFFECFAGDLLGNELPGIICGNSPSEGRIAIKATPWQIVTLYIKI